MYARLIAAVLLGSCAASLVSPPPPCDTNATWAAAVAHAMIADLSQAGMYVAGDVGSMIFTHGNVYDNNPSSLYGTYRFTALDLPVFFLGASDAVLWVGCTPPPLKYFSARSYLYATARLNATVFASLGDSNNIETFNTTNNGGSVCNSTAAVITTADMRTAADISAALVRAGFPGEAINIDVVPAPLVSLCRNLSCDLFNYLLRVALFDDAAAGAAYTNATWPVYNVYATAARSASPVPFGVPTLRPRGAVDLEQWMSPSLDALQAAAAAFWTRQGATLTLQRGVPVNTTGFACIADGSDCAGDNRDAAYVAAAAPVRIPDQRTLLLVAGVDHAALTGCTYSNFDVNDDNTGKGVDGVDNAHFNGSAAVYGSFANAELMYAFVVARNCTMLPAPQSSYCVQVTEQQVPLSHYISIAERAYLQVTTRTGPNATLLLMPYITTVVLP